MSVNVKALRALHAFLANDDDFAVEPTTGLNSDEAVTELLNALPDLLALAEAVRELAPVLRQLDVTLPVYPTATVQALARRVTAILEGK